MGAYLCRVCELASREGRALSLSSKIQQLKLGFPECQFNFDEICVSDANRSALRIVQNPDNWPSPVVCLVGPKMSGLSSIVSTWGRAFEADVFSAKAFQALKLKDANGLGEGFIAVDDADLIKDVDRLLTLINVTTNQNGRLLLASHLPPPQWSISSPDLKSRLNAMTLAEIDAPDEKMLSERLLASAKRDFLKLDEDTLKYLVPRLDLSYVAIERFIARLNEAVVETGRAPSVPLAREVLEEMGLDSLDQRPLL